MNELTKELAEQAGIGPWGITIDKSTEIFQKFAELIVKECARKVNEDTTPDSGYTYEPWKLLEHFGVEE